MMNVEQQLEAREERNLDKLTTGIEELYISSTTFEHIKEANVAEMDTSSDKFGLLIQISKG